jgi:Ca-activated chloride channel family protein
VLAVAGDGPELESLKKAAAALDAPLVRVTPDDTDVRRLAANTRFSAVAERSGGDRWRDFGYWLAWPLAALTLFGFRRGWMVRASEGG